MDPKQQSNLAVDDAGEKFFTPETATQSLVLVRRVVADIVASYGEMMSLRREREALAVANTSGETIAALDRRIEQQVDRLNTLQEELAGIGCLLKDWATGLVDFPARRDGRVVYLCWKLGEERIDHWHEVHAGFSGRQPIDGAFES